MKISIIVPAFNEEKLIGRTLDTIEKARQVFTDRGWESEVVVCDNNSTDRTAEIARAHGARVVFEPVNQIARARNAGAAAAEGDWFLFVDADSVPSPGLFREVCASIESGRYLFGGATVRFDEAPLSARMVGEVWNTISRVGKYVAGSFIFCPAEAFRAVGGFSRELFAGEELDLSNKLKALARERKLSCRIINRPRLVTSGRKLKLYRQMEILSFMVRASLRPRAVLASREECAFWYDGRR